MKILILDTWAKPYKNGVVPGGTEMVSLWLSRYLKADLFTCYTDDKIEGVNFVFSKVPPKVSWKDTDSSREFNRIRTKEIIELATNYDLIINNSWITGHISSLREIKIATKKPMIHWWHLLAQFSFPFFQAIKSMNIASDAGVLIATVTNFSKEAIDKAVKQKSKYIGYNTNPVSYYCYPFVSEVFEYHEPRGNYMYSASSLSEFKNVPMALQIFAQLRKIDPTLTFKVFILNSDKNEYYEKFLKLVANTPGVELYENRPRSESLEVAKYAKFGITACTNESFGIVPAENSCYGVPNLIVTNADGSHAYKEVYPKDYFFPLTKANKAAWSNPENFKVIEEQYKRITSVDRHALVNLAENTFNAKMFEARLNEMIEACMNMKRDDKVGLDLFMDK